MCVCGGGVYNVKKIFNFFFFERLGLNNELVHEQKKNFFMFDLCPLSNCNVSFSQKKKKKIIARQTDSFDEKVQKIARN